MYSSGDSTPDRLAAVIPDNQLVEGRVLTEDELHLGGIRVSDILDNAS